MRYLPFLDGTYSTAPGLIAMAKAGKMDQTIFQLDEQYDRYISNKSDCRKEDIHKYYLEKDLYPETLIHVNQLLVAQLTKEYPEIFVLTSQRSAYLLNNKRTGETLKWNRDWITIDQPPYLSLF